VIDNRIVPARSAGRTVNEPNPATTFGFRSLTEFAQSVRRASVGSGFDPRLNGALEAAAPATVNENFGSGGEGFLVPPDFSRTVWEITFEQTDLLGMCAPEPTRSNSVFKPKDEVTPWGAVGVQAVWASEAATLTATKIAMTGDLMMLHKIYAFTAASDEILDDAPMMQDRLTRQAGRALRYKISDAIVWGNGVGQPLGFMNAPSKISVAKDAAQAAATLSVANILNMAARMLRLGGKPFWIVNQDCIPQLGALTFGTFPAWLPFNQPISGDVFEGRLIGYPVMFSEHAQTLGTEGDVTTKADGGIDFAQSIHLYFDSGLTAFRWTFRVAGQPYLSAPVQPAHGANTKSHFISLATRA
jgi:HK97 family phage major capsid protein